MLCSGESNKSRGGGMIAFTTPELERTGVWDNFRGKIMAGLGGSNSTVSGIDGATSSGGLAVRSGGEIAVDFCFVVGFLRSLSFDTQLKKPCKHLNPFCSVACK